MLEEDLNAYLVLWMKKLSLNSNTRLMSDWDLDILLCSGPCGIFVLFKALWPLRHYLEELLIEDWTQ